MIDILLVETGSGGDMLLRNNDVVTVSGYENMPYLGMYGGAESWMDGLFMTGTQQHTCRTEEVCNTTPLNSAGRQKIEEAIVEDLSFLEEITNGTSMQVETVIAAKNRVNANIKGAGLQIYMGWNPDKSFLTYKLR